MSMNRISIFSPSLSPCDSYGVIANNLCTHLTDMGATVNMLGFDKSSTGYLPPSDAAICLGWPTMFAAFPPVDGPKIAITMFESSRPPASWTPILNTMGAVIVPSTFSLDMFRSAGVTAPLYKFPLGVDPLYQPVRRTPSDVTTFLAFMDRGKRKGGTVAIQAFLTAFGDNPKYQLVLKGRRPGKQIILFDNPNIKLIQQDMSEQELYELYCRCDVMIFPTMGEGFGLPPREFSASGGVTLATAWGGTADDIEQWGYPIPYELVPADWTGQPGLEGLDLGQWAMPCIDSLAAQMQQIVEHRSIYADIAYQSAPHVHELYSWRRFAEQVYDVWRGLR